MLILGCNHTKRLFRWSDVGNLSKRSLTKVESDWRDQLTSTIGALDIYTEPNVNGKLELSIGRNAARDAE